MLLDHFVLVLVLDGFVVVVAVVVVVVVVAFVVAVVLMSHLCAAALFCSLLPPCACRLLCFDFSKQIFGVAATHTDHPSS